MLSGKEREQFRSEADQLLATEAMQLVMISQRAEADAETTACNQRAISMRVWSWLYNLMHFAQFDYFGHVEGRSGKYKMI